MSTVITLGVLDTEGPPALKVDPLPKAQNESRTVLELCSSSFSRDRTILATEESLLYFFFLRSSILSIPKGNVQKRLSVSLLGCYEALRP